jgi:hypothetical protein
MVVETSAVDLRSSDGYDELSPATLRRICRDVVPRLAAVVEAIHMNQELVDHCSFWRGSAGLSDSERFVLDILVAVAGVGLDSE